MSWPERVLTQHNVSKLECDYIYRPYASATISAGKASLAHDNSGVTKVVFAAAKKKFDPKALLVLNPFQATTKTQTSDHERYRVEWTYPGPLVELAGPVAGMLNLPYMSTQNIADPWLDRYAQASLIEAHAGLINKPADVGMMLAEARETINALRSPLKSLCTLSSRFIRDVFRKAPRKIQGKPSELAKVASDTWMEGRYGFLPLMSDIESLSKLAIRKLDAPMLRCHGSSNGPGSTFSYDPVRKDVLILRTFWRRFLRTQTRANTGLYFKTASGWTMWEHTLDSLGLSPYDIPSIMYELIPLSFVGDWFLDVGTWLRAMRPKPSLDVLGSYTTVTDVSTTEWVCTHVETSYSSFKPSRACRSRCSQETRSINRKIGLPLPSVPSWGSGISGIARALDSASLLWQRAPKLKSIF